MMMLGQLFSKPEKISVYWSRMLEEMIQLGIKSIGIVILMSAFMGMVIVIQTATAIDSPLIPDYTVGFTTKQSILLEFSPTIICLILAGKVGSNIASELGSMRVTEQIDALDIMGVNSINHLISPKIVASVLVFPLVIIFSMVFGFFGGAIACWTTDLVEVDKYIYGLVIFNGDDFMYLCYALGKTAMFAFIISSISSYQGYYVKGGSLEVGKASTSAVVYSSVLILTFNYVITQLVLI
ncbi:MAG: phospholipid/cholesterol/gamma-HCH transport system permease protein [Flavobacteriales bacterium]|jgi:phospholipid/cholesterol/gamma-HCH transport system permease protein